MERYKSSPQSNAEKATEMLIEMLTGATRVKITGVTNVDAVDGEFSEIFGIEVAIDRDSKSLTLHSEEPIDENGAYPLSGIIIALSMQNPDMNGITTS